MHILRLETKEELLEILEWIFFRADGAFTEICEARLNFEDTCSILGINSDLLVDPAIEVDSDEWYEAIDGMEDDVLKAYILSDEFEMVRDFTPGILTWCLEDDWDRVGDLSIRVFIFTPDKDVAFSVHKAWREEQQKEYEQAIANEEFMKRARKAVDAGQPWPEV